MVVLPSEDSPDPFAGRTTTLAPPMPATPAGIKPPRRSASRSFANEGSVSPALPPLPTPSGVATHDPLAALNADEPAEAEDLTPYCYCSRPSFGEMIGCEGESCAIEWVSRARFTRCRPVPDARVLTKFLGWRGSST